MDAPQGSKTDGASKIDSLCPHFFLRGQGQFVGEGFARRWMPKHEPWISIRFRMSIFQEWVSINTSFKHRLQSMGLNTQKQWLTQVLFFTLAWKKKLNATNQWIELLTSNFSVIEVLNVKRSVWILNACNFRVKVLSWFLGSKMQCFSLQIWDQNMKFWSKNWSLGSFLGQECDDSDYAFKLWVKSWSVDGVPWMLRQIAMKYTYEKRMFRRRWRRIGTLSVVILTPKKTSIFLKVTYLIPCNFFRGRTEGKSGKGELSNSSRAKFAMLKGFW